MRLSEFKLGQHYLEILLMMSKYISKEITGSVDIPLVLNSYKFFPQRLTENRLMSFSVNDVYDENLDRKIEKCEFKLTALDKEYMSKIVIILVCNIYNQNIILHEINPDNFAITEITKLTYNYEFIEFIMKKYSTIMILNHLIDVYLS